MSMVAALPVAQAAAQSGTGLYEPFPEAAVKKRAQRYVEGLRSRTAEPGRRYSDTELAAGVFVHADAAVPQLEQAGQSTAPGPATARAGEGGTGVALPLQLLLLALALGVPATAALRRPRTDAA